MGIETPDAPARQELMKQIGESDSYKNLVCFLERMLGEKETAQEIAQKTCLKLYRLVWPKEVIGARALLFDAATRLAIAYIGRTRAGGASIDAAVIDDAEILAAIDSSWSPDSSAAAEQAVQQLSQIVVELPGDLREVYLMRYVRKLSREQIAERLNIDVGAVEQRLTRALAECRKGLSNLERLT